jgi:hypothetical protein
MTYGLFCTRRGGEFSVPVPVPVPVPLLLLLLLRLVIAKHSLVKYCQCNKTAAGNVQLVLERRCTEGGWDDYCND